MSRRRRSRRTADAAKAVQPVRTQDGFQNFAARVGQGTDNLSSADRYGFGKFISRDRSQLEACYRSSWICGQVVDVIAEDMTREGIDLRCENAPEQQDAFTHAMERLDVWGSLTETIKWARLYGGAVGVLLIDGQDMSTPLDVSTVGNGAFRGILPLDRWTALPSLDKLVQSYGPDFGKPESYHVTADAMALKDMDIHHSRVVRFEGVTLPYWQAITEEGWGQSVLERLWDRLTAFDSVTEGTAQLVYKAHLRHLGIKDFRKVVASGGPIYEALLKQVSMMRRFQSNEHVSVTDADDVFQTHSYTFSGLADVLLHMGMQISGATGIPLVRLFGQSPAGLSSTGESDFENYYTNVLAQCERELRPALAKIIPVVWMSVNGEQIDAGYSFRFNSLKPLNDIQKAETALKVSDAVLKAYDSQVIGRKTALMELKQSSEQTGLFASITDEDIEEADNDIDMPELPEGGLLNGETPPQSNENRTDGNVLPPPVIPGV